MPRNEAGEQDEREHTDARELRVVVRGGVDVMREPLGCGPHVHDAADADEEDQVANMPSEDAGERAPDNEDRGRGEVHEAAARADGGREAGGYCAALLLGYAREQVVGEEHGRGRLTGERRDDRSGDDRTADPEHPLERGHDGHHVRDHEVRGRHDAEQRERLGEREVVYHVHGAREVQGDEGDDTDEDAGELALVRDEVEHRGEAPQRLQERRTLGGRLPERHATRREPEVGAREAVHAEYCGREKEEARHTGVSSCDVRQYEECEGHGGKPRPDEGLPKQFSQPLRGIHCCRFHDVPPPQRAGLEPSNLHHGVVTYLVRIGSLFANKKSLQM